MIPDKKEFRRKVLLRLLSSPSTIAPMLAGVTILFGIWAMSPAGAGLWGFGALACILLSAGVALTRLTLHGEEMGKQVIDEMHQAAREQRTRALDELEHRLVRDGDPRTEQHLRDLRALASGLRASIEASSKWSSSVDAYSTLEIVGKVEGLFSLSVESIERTLTLWQTAEQIGSEAARKPLLQEREELIADVGQTIAQLGRILADIQRLSTGHGTVSDLAQIREQLDRSIGTARAVQAEVAEWERDLEDSAADFEASHSETDVTQGVREME